MHYTARGLQMENEHGPSLVILSEAKDLCTCRPQKRCERAGSSLQDVKFVT
jgi:hypothetical protein